MHPHPGSFCGRAAPAGSALRTLVVIEQLLGPSTGGAQQGCEWGQRAAPAGSTLRTLVIDVPLLGPSTGGAPGGSALPPLAVFLPLLGPSTWGAQSLKRIVNESSCAAAHIECLHLSSAKRISIAKQISTFVKSISFVWRRKDDIADGIDIC